YEGNLNKWILPCFGEYQLNDITLAMVHKFIFEHVNGVSMQAKRTILKHIKRLFEMAIEQGLCIKNPAKVIKVKVPEAKNLVFNKTEIDKLLLEAKKLSPPY